MTRLDHDTITSRHHYVMMRYGATCSDLMRHDTARRMLTVRYGAAWPGLGPRGEPARSAGAGGGGAGGGPGRTSADQTTLAPKTPPPPGAAFSPKTPQDPSALRAEAREKGCLLALGAKGDPFWGLHLIGLMLL